MEMQLTSRRLLIKTVCRSRGIPRKFLKSFAQTQLFARLRRQTIDGGVFEL